ncbi:MAG TPA: right-handed parallel beta-helix repeat-containing protein [Chitinophaga sp.]|uniref:right-handed parallel beta-helix repeat-containing protein n=1 Tax=Chitinophaga sp. TaxID=1869181 RepID=UPI002CA3112D|nr:right-handed parallel beta-helix repeat-containing protein [Chitinophaga sp.]HVI48375.1 right-handed parallel beta-helix repeat-containing protein [Chitinophaga sp.]
MKAVNHFFLYVLFLTSTHILFAQRKTAGHEITVRPGTGVVGTLPTAILRYRTLHPEEDIIVKFTTGTYYLDTTLLITPAMTTGNGHIILCKASAGDKVTLSGGKPLQLKWKPWKDGIYSAQIAIPFDFDLLYVNDEQQIRARYPNYDSSAKHYNGSAADALSPARVKTWKHPEGGYVHALHKAEWGGYHYRITGVNNDGTLQLEGGYQNNRQMGMHAQHRFVENILEELDGPREWYYNKATQTLYYKPLPGTDLNKATIVVSRLPQVITLKGSSQAPVKNVKIEGFRIAHTAPTFMDTREPLLRSDWTIYRGGAVMLDGTRNCSILQCDFDHNGGNAVFVSNYNRGAMISGCNIHDAGGSGICFVGNPAAVRSPLFEYNKSQEFTAIDTVSGPKTPDYPDSCTASDNLIHHTGRIEKQSAGVQISMAMDITVSHNTIYNVPRAGINISEGTWGGHVIEYNDVFNTVLETGDHGAFNSWGRDRYWHPDREKMDSLVQLYPWLVKLDVIKTIVLRNNRFRCDHGWDIDLDDGSSNYHIYNNVCLNGGLKLREGFYRTAENNIILNNSFHPHVWFANSHDTFRYNIVTAGYKPIGIRYWGDEIDYNFFPDKNSLPASTDAHSLYGDPQFIHPSTGDYRVKPGSPALKTGFRNFAMDSFGVVSPGLKRVAARPPLPVLQQQQQQQGLIITWKGARVKNIETLGERSATGLPDNNGAYFVEVPAGFKNCIKTGDVVLKVGDEAIRNVNEMIKAFEKNKTKKVKVTIFRHQNYDYCDWYDADDERR